eukprot:284815005_2
MMESSSSVLSAHDPSCVFASSGCAGRPCVNSFWFLQSWTDDCVTGSRVVAAVLISVRDFQTSLEVGRDSVVPVSPNGRRNFCILSIASCFCFSLISSIMLFWRSMICFSSSGEWDNPSRLHSRAIVFIFLLPPSIVFIKDGTSILYPPITTVVVWSWSIRDPTSFAIGPLLGKDALKGRLRSFIPIGSGCVSISSSCITGSGAFCSALVGVPAAGAGIRGKTDGSPCWLDICWTASSRSWMIDGRSCRLSGCIS